MEEMTLFLAKLLGPIAFVFGLSFAIKHREYFDWFKKLHKEQPYLLLQGAVESTAGLALVLSHNMWSTLPEIVISTIGWLLLLEGTFVLLVDKLSLKRMIRGALNPGMVVFSSVFLLVLGGYLSWVGYMM